MSDYILRQISSKVLEAATYFPVIVVTGPRQSGKTSLCRHLFADFEYINLENITTRAAAVSDPTAFIEQAGDAVIIDEVQHSPELLSLIQIRVDEDKRRKYILTGSSNFSLLKSVTQSLAGRAALFTLLPLSFTEMNAKEIDGGIDFLMWRGQYPGIIVNQIPSYLFYQNYYNTYVERDLRDLLKLKNLLSFDKFMRLLASRVGTEFNASSLSREVGVSSPTITEWLSLLATSYIAFPLRPYFSNISKRLTKMSKIYFYDTGLLCYLLGIEKHTQLERHPLKGAIFENLAIVELLKRRCNKALDPNLYFLREQSGMEVDAIVMTPEGLELYEIKSGKTFRQEYAGNMKTIAAALHNIKSTTVIYDGESIPPITINIREV